MKTNILKNITLGCCLMAGLVLTACEDFLTITPTNSIVEEEFWQDKNDLENVIGACYKRLVDNDILTKYVQWGELRSDNFELALGVSSTDIRNLMNANLLPTNWIFDWEAFYNVINYCNKVLAHGPEVLSRDESFSESDWQPLKAEVMTLRAFSHFWLVRTFGEIPYVNIDYNNDEQESKQPQVTQLSVLDSIVADLEVAKDIAMKDYNNIVFNKGRVTQKTVLTLLADVYLWRACYKAGNNKPFEIDGVVRPEEVYSVSAQQDYQSCIDCCNRVIELAIEEKRKSLIESGNIIGDELEIELEDLIVANGASSSGMSTVTTSAYNSIFGTGNSSESIFELQVDGTSYSNSLVTSYFWNIKEDKSATLNCSNSLFSSADETPNILEPTSVYAITDLRRWETVRYEKQGQTSLPIAKYVMRSISQSTASNSMANNTNENLKVTNTPRTLPCDANWIVYRMSDVFLMKAEAMSQIYEDEVNLTEAFNLCRLTYKRSNPYAYSTSGTGDSLNIDVFLSPHGIESLVLAERQREFVGEGKRWFDLVRYALRDGNTEAMLNLLTRKFAAENKKAIAAKLSTIQSLFSPIQSDELKVNNMLHQNKVWAVDESTSKTDEL